VTGRDLRKSTTLGNVHEGTEFYERIAKNARVWRSTPAVLVNEVLNDRTAEFLGKVNALKRYVQLPSRGRGTRYCVVGNAPKHHNRALNLVTSASQQRCSSR